ncbi:MAG: flagellar basal-body rod protein FlgG [Acidobacteria bacterium]|nr:flagellar basal-body rod protein FlgG [Acidobacteriota bacterium]
MIRAFYTAASGMQAQQLNVDNIANNLANVNTSGFKRARAQFQDLLYQNLRTAGTASTQSKEFPVGLEVGLGTRAVSTERVFMQGDFKQTGNPLDMVIAGAGFFQVLLPTGEIGYTRSGEFHMDREGSVVTADGLSLEPQVTVPSDAVSISIGQDGVVSVIQAGQAQAQQVGSIELATFPNPAGLSPQGRNLFIATTSSGDPITGIPGENGLGTIQQGFVEQSNVSVVEEFVNMIIAQRAYEANSKVIRTADDMLSQVNNLSR